MVQGKNVKKEDFFNKRGGKGMLIHHPACAQWTGISLISM
jgi:hypothetical protein